MNPVDKFLASLRAEIDWARGLDWALPDVPEDPPGVGGMRLQSLQESSFGPLQAAQSLDGVRWELASKAHEYAIGKGKGMLLVKVPAGVGKTHALVGVAQAAARAGGRVLWAAQDHAAWEDFSSFPDFDGEAWVHWQGLLRIGDNGEPMCRYAYAMQTWIARGYPSREICRRLCLQDGWMADGCPYTAQGNSKQRCIFGQHAHLVWGMPIGAFSLAIVDELPLKAFTRERVIPWRKGIYPIHTRLRGGGLSGDLFAALVEVSYRAPLDGRALMDILGPVLTDVYAAVETGFWRHPEIPPIFCPEDVADVEYFFLHDLLSALTIGYEAWRAGWPDWAHRVWASPRGLHILGRHGLWDELPYKVIILDATAQPDLYRMMFRERMEDGEGVVRWRRRKIREVYAPRVERAGRFYQVTGRLYSKKQLYKVTQQVVITHEDGKQETNKTIEALPALRQAAQTVVGLARKHGARTVGLVTYKAAETLLAAEIAGSGLEVLSRHFYNVRGTNALQDVDLVAVVGSPTPNQTDMIKLATALDAARQLPFLKRNADGKFEPVYISRVEELRLTPAAMKAMQARDGWSEAAGVGRRIGVYKDFALRAIHDQTRGAEVLQAGHRGRVNIQDVPVYVLTSTPLLDEPLDGVWDDPPFGPEDVPWRTWLLIEPWLDSLALGSVVDAGLLAERLGLSASYIKSSKWIQAIIAYYAGLGTPDAERWQLYAMQKGRGRPKVRMIREEVAALDSIKQHANI